MFCGAQLCRKFVVKAKNDKDYFIVSRAVIRRDMMHESVTYRAILREGREEGREEQTIALVTRLLKRRLGEELSEEMRSRPSQLALPVLEDLSEALLDFTTLSDLEAWLAERGLL
jgi:predicted transposase YdaD